MGVEDAFFLGVEALPVGLVVAPDRARIISMPRRAVWPGEEVLVGRVGGAGGGEVGGARGGGWFRVRARPEQRSGKLLREKSRGRLLTATSAARWYSGARYSRGFMVLEVV